MEIIRTGQFENMLKKLTEDDSDMSELIKEKIKLFKKNTDDTRLNNHPLGRRLKGKRAFNITGDIRIVFEPQGKHRVRFLTIGGHKEVYGR